MGTLINFEDLKEKEDLKDFRETEEIRDPLVLLVLKDLREKGG